MAEETHARKTLNAINAVIEKRATSDHQSYAINGMAVTKMKIDELLAFQRVYQRKVAKEENPNRKRFGHLSLGPSDLF